MRGERRTENLLASAERLQGEFHSVKDRNRWPIFQPIGRTVDVQRPRTSWNCPVIQHDPVCFDAPDATLANDVVDAVQLFELSKPDRCTSIHRGSNVTAQAKQSAAGHKPFEQIVDGGRLGDSLIAP
jgi:hypothetical protein